MLDSIKTIPTPCWTELPRSYYVAQETMAEEKAMYEFNIDQHRIEHLNDRLSSINMKHYTDIEIHFGILDDDPPYTMETFVKRIQDGKFIVPEDRLQKSTWDCMRNIRWRDPSVKADKAGADKAHAKLREAFLSAYDTINVKSADEGLKAVQEFEKRKFH